MLLVFANVHNICLFSCFDLSRIFLQHPGWGLLLSLVRVLLRLTDVLELLNGHFTGLSAIASSWSAVRAMRGYSSLVVVLVDSLHHRNTIIVADFAML